MNRYNGYISLNHAMSLLQNGWLFRQDLKQTEFKIKRKENSLDWYKINKKVATELKKQINQLNNQTKICL